MVHWAGRIALLAFAAVGLYFASTLLFQSNVPTKQCVHVEGMESCPYYQRSVQLAQTLETQDGFGKTGVKGWTREEWQSSRKGELWKLIPSAAERKHTTSPFVWIRDCSDGDLAKNPQNAYKNVDFIGGNDAFHAWESKRRGKDEL
ncbi:hypothetical protein BCR33DRAFT_64406 [Rhizoclosmatium globosum]|uniref:Uncharacterized protein n=1 Tax=Rhizoclosmatium globosum TaxID=329046 RepID=A0A1Y2CNC3_9FUNG|nr:hypothetical protein BCR33DRAFT_64406 [Rhizoclosmatium globosum]|eukprot:ORY48324.1 hypothetical protein BCR33DRAFT_64406 [Rhizoclosmatium globosum]